MKTKQTQTFTIEATFEGRDAMVAEYVSIDGVLNCLQKRPDVGLVLQSGTRELLSRLIFERLKVLQLLLKLPEK